MGMREKQRLIERWSQRRLMPTAITVSFVRMGPAFVSFSIPSQRYMAWTATLDYHKKYLYSNFALFIYLIGFLLESYLI